MATLWGGKQYLGQQHTRRASSKHSVHTLPSALQQHRHTSPRQLHQRASPSIAPAPLFLSSPPSSRHSLVAHAGGELTFNPDFVEVEELKGVRLVIEGDVERAEYLVKWKASAGVWGTEGLAGAWGCRGGWGRGAGVAGWLPGCLAGWGMGLQGWLAAWGGRGAGVAGWLGVH